MLTLVVMCCEWLLVTKNQKTTFREGVAKLLSSSGPGPSQAHLRSIHSVKFVSIQLQNTGPGATSLTIKGCIKLHHQN